MSTEHPAPRTSTVSICVNHDESEAIRNAAAATGLTVSAWAATRCVAALATGRNRAEVKLAMDNAPVLGRMGRKERISMVLQEQDRDNLRKRAEALEVSAHALAQGALIHAAAKEIGALKPSELRVIEAARREDKKKGTVLVSVPPDVAQLDVDALSKLLRALVAGTVRAIMGGSAQAIADGALRLAQAHDAGPRLTIKLNMPEFEIKAVAFVLGIPAAAVGTAFAIKAARKLREGR